MYLKKMYDKYQDPTLALAAYNAGPGRVDRALKSGQGIASLPRETQNYIMATRMAEGGIVAFQAGGLNPEFGGGSDVETIMYDPYFVTDPMTGEKMYSGYREKARGALPSTASKDSIISSAANLPARTEKPQFNFPPQGGIGPTDTELGRDTATAAAAPSLESFKEPPPDGGLSDIKNLLKQRMEESGKQRRIDAYMSLLQAGLGMMGGTSPNALTNIGQGASQGVAAQMAARRAQVADENAILTGQLGLSRAELYEKLRRDALTQKAEETKFSQGLRERQLGVNTLRANEAVRANQLKLGDLRRKATQDWDNSPDKLALEKELSRQKKNWRQDPKLLGQFEMMRNRFINDFVNVGQEDNTPNASQL
jgi:hypothetical protein